MLNDGSHIGTFMVPVKNEVAKAIQDAAGIHVGHVMARVKIVPDITRVYRYHRFGYTFLV